VYAELTDGSVGGTAKLRPTGAPADTLGCCRTQAAADGASATAPWEQLSIGSAGTLVQHH